MKIVKFKLDRNLTASQASQDLRISLESGRVCTGDISKPKRISDPVSRDYKLFCSMIECSVPPLLVQAGKGYKSAYGKA